MGKNWLIRHVVYSSTGGEWPGDKVIQLKQMHADREQQLFLVSQHTVDGYNR